MKDHDSATIVITFLLLLPWLERAAVSAMEVCEQARSPKPTKQNRLRIADYVCLAIRADAHRCGVKVWPIETARNFGVTSANGFRNAGRKSTRNACRGKVIPL